MKRCNTCKGRQESYPKQTVCASLASWKQGWITEIRWVAQNLQWAGLWRSPHPTSRSMIREDSLFHGSSTGDQPAPAWSIPSGCPNRVREFQAGESPSSGSLSAFQWLSLIAPTACWTPQLLPHTSPAVLDQSLVPSASPPLGLNVPRSFSHSSRVLASRTNRMLHPHHFNLSHSLVPLCIYLELSIPGTQQLPSIPRRPCSCVSLPCSTTWLTTFSRPKC